MKLINYLLQRALKQRIYIILYESAIFDFH